MGGGPGPASAAACSCAPASRRLSSSLATPCGSSRAAWAAARRPARRPARARPPPAGCPAACHAAGSSRGAWAAARPASAAACSCAPASRRLSSGWPRRPGCRGRRGRPGRGPAARRPARARPPPQAVQQHGHAGRVVEGGVRGGIAGRQRGGLLVRARPPQAVQQHGHAARVAEGGVGGGPVRGAGVRAQAGRRIAEVEGGAEVTGCGGVLVQLGGVPVQAASVGGVAERGLVAGRGVRGGGGPELRRGDLAGAVRPAVLVQVVREPVQRPAAAACWRAGPPRWRAARLAGRGRMRVSGPRTPCTGRRCRPGPVPASPRRGRPIRSSVRYPGAAASRKACGRPAPMPRRRASIAASISAAAAGGALRYRASSSGAPARNWITCPVRAPAGPPAPSARRRPGELAHLRRGERGGHGDVVPGQQLPRLRVPVVPAGRAGGQGVPELRPQGGQHQHRGPAGSRSSSRSPAATRSPSPASAASR